MSANVEIEYCVPCGDLNRAIDTQRASWNTSAATSTGYCSRPDTEGSSPSASTAKEPTRTPRASTSTRSSPTSRNETGSA